MGIDVEWPGRRGDVLAALELLESEPPLLDSNGRDPRWPDLTNAVHWLVDDTVWDHFDPSESIGTILRAETEATAIRAVVSALLEVADRQRSGTDSSWFEDARWHSVRELARVAIDAMPFD